MEYIVEELEKNKRKGHNFKILIEENKDIASVVIKLSKELLFLENNLLDKFITWDGREGYIILREGEIKIEPEDKGFGLNTRKNDLYQITSRRMSFEEFKKIYLYLKK